MKTHFGSNAWVVVLAMFASALLTACHYNPSSPSTTTGSWTTASSDGFTRRYALASAVVNGKIYVIGGNITQHSSDLVEVYDPATDTWSSTTGMPTRREFHSASVVGNKIYVIGGST